MHKLASCVAALSALVLASPALATNLLINGSFETPVLSATYQNYAVGSNGLTGWQIVGPSFESLSQVRSDFAGNPGYLMPAEDGNYWLDLAGFVSNSPTGIMQAIATTPGTTYDLTYWVGNISGGFFGTQTQIGVEFSSGGTNTSCTNTTSATTMAWQLCSYSFVATDLSTSIIFRNLDPSSDFSAAIDNISLSVAPVPTPESWVMMLAGLGMIGVITRRKGRGAMRAS